MDSQAMLDRYRKLAAPFRIDHGRRFRLRDIDPGETLGLNREDKARAREALALGTQALAEFQDKLYAQDKWGVLLISRRWMPRARTGPSST